MIAVTMGAVIAVVLVVIKVLVEVAATINMVVTVEVLPIEVRAGVGDALTGVEIIVSVELLADGNANVFASLMTALEFALLKP